VSKKRDRVDAVRQGTDVDSTGFVGDLLSLPRIEEVADEKGDRDGWQYLSVQKFVRKSQNISTQCVDQYELNEVVQRQAKEAVDITPNKPAHSDLPLGKIYGDDLPECSPCNNNPPMIQLDRVQKQYGERVLFSDLSWQLRPGLRIGLIGPNGGGKSTLFGMLTGTVEPDAGRVVLPRDTSVGLLPQELDELADTPVLEYGLEGRLDLIELTAEIETTTVRLAEATGEEANRLTEKLGALQSRFEDGGGYRVEADLRAILTGMGFKESDLTRSASELSGGWRMRLALARLLLQRPDVLLMDEPTNHLDVPSLEWLEDFLQSYAGTLVVVSHDRYFLDRLANEIVALEVDGFYTHPGNLTSYFASRDQQLELLKRTRAQQEKHIKRTEKFVERFRYKATKAKQVQSRVKQLEKIERIALPGDRKKVAFRFPEAPRAGKTMCTIKDASVRYGDLTVYEGLNWQVNRGDRIALVGPNGEGKSTLLKLLVGSLQPTDGSVSLGHQVFKGYFAQHQVEALDLGASVLGELQSHATDESHSRCRTILGAFLFSGDDVEKKVAVLSGGERARVALAKLLLRPVNFLLLDEPTNHLDMESRDVLVKAIQSFEGTLIFVSHDRSFINALATRVVHVEGGECIDYPGDYDYYRFKRAEEKSLASSPDASADESEPRTGDESRVSRKEERRLAAERRKRLYKELKPLKEELAVIDEEVARREAAVESLESQLADPELYSNADKLRELSEQHGAHKAKLPDLYDRWLDVTGRIEEIEVGDESD